MTATTQAAERFLWLLSFAASLAFATWQTLLNNFAIEQAGFGGVQIGILQSLREVPGFLAFTTVFVLLLLREQTFAVLSIALLGLGVALTGFFPQEYAFYLTTILMSVGFHYFFTLQKSLALQWVASERTPVILGRLSAARSYAAILVFGMIWLGLEFWQLGFEWIYLLAGGATVVLAIWSWRAFPRFSHHVPQHKHLLMRRRYWLYYALTFMSGARRQIFVVFAGFLMVEKFGYGASDIALLFLLNHLVNTWAAPRIGALVARWGERSALTLEYVGLIVIFTSYAFVDVAWLAGAAVRPRPPAVRDGDRDRELFQEDCRPAGHRLDRRRVVHHQPHCRGRDSGDLRLRLDPLARRGFPDGFGDGRRLAAAGADDPARTGRRR